MHMSKDRIYDQLTSEYGEQFTKEEAQYAIDKHNSEILILDDGFQHIKLKRDLNISIVLT